MLSFFKSFRELEFALRALDLKIAEQRVELDALKDALDDARKEKEEFKQLLFRRVGLIEPENSNSGTLEFKPIVRQPVQKVLKDLEARDRAWAKKAEEAAKVLQAEESNDKKE